MRDPEVPSGGVHDEARAGNFRCDVARGHKRSVSTVFERDNQRGRPDLLKCNRLWRARETRVIQKALGPFANGQDVAKYIQGSPALLGTSGSYYNGIRAEHGPEHLISCQLHPKPKGKIGLDSELNNRSRASCRTGQTAFCERYPGNQ